VVAEIKAGFEIERLADGKILAYRFSDIYRTTVDAWVESIKVEYAAWQGEQLRTMLDLRRTGGVVSIYAINAARPLAALRPELRGRLAIMVQSRIAAQIIGAAIRTNYNPTRRRMLFSDERMAVDWLLRSD